MVGINPQIFETMLSKTWDVISLVENLLLKIEKIHGVKTPEKIISPDIDMPVARACEVYLSALDVYIDRIKNLNEHLNTLDLITTTNTPSLPDANTPSLTDTEHN